MPNADTDLTATAARELRRRVPRRRLGELRLPENRDPVGILVHQHASRLADLVPVRIGRMSQTPFTYYRGTAGVMAADLAAGVDMGETVVSCGDAHISNFGFFASPERTLLFDLNDFDEAGIAPWEWDLKRLTASVHIGGLDIDMSDDACRDATEAAAMAYATKLNELMQLSAIERFYYTVDSSAVSASIDSKSTQKAVRKARTRTSAQLIGKLAVREGDNCQLRIVDQPPVARHVDHATIEQLEGLFLQYLSTVREDSAFLLEQFRLVDFVLRVVGVGSVGTRCYVLAFEGPSGEVLFLQPKEAQSSVLTTFGGMPEVIPGACGDVDHSEGHRVVACQRILQAHSDPFLGHIVGWAGEQADRPRVDYYWRQFRDMKGSIDPALLTPGQFVAYGVLCGEMLARAHAQSPAAGVISAYIGKGGRVAKSISDWSAAYAQVCEADFAALHRAIDAGTLPIELGV